MTSSTKTADAPTTEKAPRRARTTRSAVATNKATKRPGATESAVAVKPQEAPAVPAPKREIADDKTRKELELRLGRAKEAGWSRPQIAEAAFGSPDAHYPVWRAQLAARGVYVEHVDALIKFCTEVETGLLKLPERAARTTPAGPSKATLAAECAQLRAVIESVRHLTDTVARSLGKVATEKERILARRVLGLLGTDDQEDRS